MEPPTPDAVDDQSFVATLHDDVLTIAGEIDELSGPALRSAIETHTDSYQRGLTVDLSPVTFLPSLGVGVLAVAMRKARDSGHEIVLRAVEGSISQRVLAICNLPHEVI